MKRRTWLLNVLLLAALCLPSATPAAARIGTGPDSLPDAPLAPSRPSEPFAVASGRVIVKLRSNAGMANDSQGRLRTGVASLDSLLAAQGTSASHPLLTRQQSQQANDGLRRIFRIDMAAGSDVARAAQLLASDPGVEWAEPDYLAYPADTTPNDPLFVQQWGLTKIVAPAAWDATTGAQTVVIAIVDSGIDLSHPDLADRLWTNPGEVAGNGLDDDNNGFVDDVRGWNFASGTNNVTDGNGHGTQVAGVAVAATNNGAGIAGVCWDCRIMPVRVMADSGVSNYSDIALGVIYAANKGAQVINLSLGGYAYSNALLEAINYATNKGAVVVGGAGNDNVTTPFYPAAYDSVLAVAGTTQADVKAAFSDYGTWVDLSAPAVEITTTFLGGDYGSASGTSLAAPFVAGAAALVRSQHPDWSGPLVRNQLLQTADSLDALNPAYAGKLGAGRVNAGGAMQDPHPVLVLAGTSVNGDPLGRPTPGQTATLTVSIRNDWWDALGVTGVLATSDPYVTLTQADASYGDLISGATGTSGPDYALAVAMGAGYNHPILFTLTLRANDGTYTAAIPITVITRSGDEHFCGTVASDQVWTRDKRYIVDCNVGIAPGYTLTIEPGTEVRFSGDYSLNVGGTLIAVGTETDPILFVGHTGNAWGRIHFDDPSGDAQATVNGTYESGNILRYTRIEGATSGIGCNNATPFLEHVTLTGGGVACVAGATALWTTDSNLDGDVQIDAGNASVIRTTAGANVSINGSGVLADSTVNGTVFVGSGIVENNTVTGGGITIGNGVVRNNSVTDGGIAVSSVLTNEVSGGGIATDVGAVIQGNVVENAPSWATSGISSTVIGNRLVGNANGIQTSSGLVQGNLIANIAGTGLEIGSATVVSNTFTGIGGSAVKITSGVPVEIAGNNFEFNTGPYDIENRILKTAVAAVAAQSNWWGTTDGVAIAKRIFDFSDEYTMGTVLYAPVLTQPSADAPAYVRAVTLSPESPVGIQAVVFDVLFSRDMDGAVPPVMVFSNRTSWATRAPMPTWRAQLAVAAAPNGRIYAIGGYDPAYPLASTRVEEYDPSTDTWRVRADLPTARFDLAAVTGLDGLIYAIGGRDRGSGDSLAAVEAYDPSADAWRTRAPIPTPRGRLAAALAQNGRIYAIGGSTAPTVVEEYDPATDTWAVRRPLPIEIEGVPAVTAANGRIYCMAAVVWEYDPASDIWKPRAPMPTPRIEAGAALAQNGRIYAIGGFDDNWQYSAVVEEYNPATDTWATGLPQMPTARRMLGAATVPSGSIYAIGGSAPGTSVAPNEEMSPWKDYGNFHDGAWITSSLYRAVFDISTLVARGLYTITVSAAVGSNDIEIAPNSAITFTVDYAGAISDSTPPPVPSVYVDMCLNSTTTAAARWVTTDPESEITLHQYAIGLTPSGGEVINWTSTSSTAFVRSGLSLAIGQRYYISVKARNEGGLWGTAGTGAFTAGVPCSRAYLPMVLRLSQ